MKIENYQGVNGLTVRTCMAKCIHSRRCVTERTEVFRPNVSGPWVDPDAASREAVIAVVSSCPSGALSCENNDGTPAEHTPSVNTLRIQENGPLELRGDLRIQGQAPAFRATLCRCGHSKNKPFCDQSHLGENFRATGEPNTTPTEPLVKRDGALEISWEKGGPYLMKGNIEVIAGSGRTVFRSGDVLRICRCGLSSTKPFCDGSHAREGFED
jgi:CDGSH-type Zn-finger protein/uncharacterized Fe-S cluster protein YjdI